MLLDLCLHPGCPVATEAFMCLVGSFAGHQSPRVSSVFDAGKHVVVDVVRARIGNSLATLLSRQRPSHSVRGLAHVLAASHNRWPVLSEPVATCVGMLESQAVRVEPLAAATWTWLLWCYTRCGCSSASTKRPASRS